MLEKAVAPEAPPRLRTAALPIYARLIDPVEVENLAIAAAKGPPASRVTAAALWGVVAIKQPDAATKHRLFSGRRPETAGGGCGAGVFLR